VNLSEYVGRIVGSEPLVVELSETEAGGKSAVSCGKLYMLLSSGVLAIGDLVPS
jgi:hypothetical protein